MVKAFMGLGRSTADIQRPRDYSRILEMLNATNMSRYDCIGL